MKEAPANNSSFLGVLSGKDALKFDVSIDNKSIIYLGLAVFAAVLIGTAAAIFITRKIS